MQISKDFFLEYRISMRIQKSWSRRNRTVEHRDTRVWSSNFNAFELEIMREHSKSSILVRLRLIHPSWPRFYHPKFQCGSKNLGLVRFERSNTEIHRFWGKNQRVRARNNARTIDILDFIIQNSNADPKNRVSPDSDLQTTEINGFEDRIRARNNARTLKFSISARLPNAIF